MRGAPIGGPHGGDGAVLVFHDVTELRRGDTMRRDFVANVSHELRTPLTAVQGYAEMLREPDLTEADAQRAVETILRNTSRMERLVQDLLRLARLDAGQEIHVDIFKEGDLVDVTGQTKGRGFTGVVKRWDYKGGRATHGSMFHRAPGSIGASSFPSRVVKGMRAGGRMGGARTTIHNLKVLRVDAENNLLIVEGGIPGAPTGYVVIRKALTAKKIKVAQVEKPKKGKK